ncbi:MAG: hypothetical protein ACFNKL_09700 [Treponema sp.]|mgnify:CR=1 FL=1
MNVIEERIPYNVHFKKPFAPTYMEQLKSKFFNNRKSTLKSDGKITADGRH